MIKWILFFFLLFCSLDIFAGKKTSPIENKLIRFSDIDYSLTLKARKFKRGEVMMVKITPKDSKLNYRTFRVKWLNKFTKVYPVNGSFITLLPLAPGMKEGHNHVTVLRRKANRVIKRRYPMLVEKTYFPKRKRSRIVNTLALPKKYDSQKKFNKETLEFIKRCSAARDKALASRTPLNINGDFTYPLDTIFITSQYNVVRQYYKKNKRPHKGVDFRAKTGTNVYAIESGRVLVASPMYFEGVFTIIDHGDQVFSLYMHQSKLKVKEGDYVRRGQVIGESGSTGMSTGPHLHLGLKVKGEFINPLSIIDLKLN
jgi:murein DD-endopeptidase